MELAFSSRSLRRICENRADAEAELGNEAAEYLRRRLADLRAAQSLVELPVGDPAFQDDTDGAIVVIRLTESYNLVVSPNHVSNPTNKAGDIAWDQVNRIKIERIEESDD